MFLRKLFTGRREERKNTLLEIIDNQLSDNDPEGIVEVFEELKKSGYSELEVRQEFAKVFEGELHRLNNSKIKEFDRDHYLAVLKAIK